MISCDIIKRMNISNLPLNHMVVFMGGSSRSWQLCRLLQAGKVFVQACAAIEQVSMYQSCARQGRLNRQSNWSCSQFCIHTFYMGYGRTWCVGCEGCWPPALPGSCCVQFTLVILMLSSFEQVQRYVSMDCTVGTTKKRQDQITVE